MAQGPVKAAMGDFDLDSLSFHGFTVKNILTNPRLLSLPRSIKVAEIFSGVGSIYRAAKKKNLEAVEYDKMRTTAAGSTSGKSEDFLTKEGFAHACEILMMMEEGGLFWIAPWCGPWMFLNTKNTKRKKSNNYWGNETYGPVRDSNNMMFGVLILLQVAALRNVEAGMENPAKSFVWHWPPLVAVIEKLGLSSVKTLRCGFDKTKQPRIWKKYRLEATGSWIQKLLKKCPCSSKEHLRTSTTTWVNGKKKCTGIKKRLQESGKYPPAMGTAFVSAWSKYSPAKEKAKKEKKKKRKATVPKKKKTIKKCQRTRSKKKDAEKPKKPAGKDPTALKGSDAPLWMTPGLGLPPKRQKPAGQPNPVSMARSQRTSEPKASSMSWLQPLVD